MLQQTFHRFTVRTAVAVASVVAMAAGLVAPTTTSASSVITPEISTIVPGSGAITGGDIITITGTDLDRVVGVPGQSNALETIYFGGSEGVGGVAGLLLTKSPTSLTAIVPRGVAAGPVDVTLVASGVKVTREAGYEYLTPEITAVSPSSGPTSGGRSITITGLGFGFTTGTLATSSISSVTVGGAPATSVNRVDSTKVTAIVPAGTAGAADVVVTVQTLGGAPIPITATGAYNYVVSPAAPTITSVSPNVGPTAGGNTVLINGTNLRGSDTNPASITFGGVAATVSSVNDENTQATVTAPPGSVGKVDVVAQTSDGRATLPDGYEYGAPPTITSITPPSGPTPGGTRITIDGTNFGSTGVPGVLVDGVAAICVDRESETRITAVVPAGAVNGAVDVVVSPQTGGGTVTASGGFSYVAPTANPVITSVSPDQGPTGGGTDVTITGSGFSGATTPTVLFNGKCAGSVTVVDDTTLSATTPDGVAGPAAIQITTSTGSSNVSETDGLFRYVSITTVSPNSGPTAGSTTIVILGSGFGTDPAVTVGGAAATVSSATDNQIIAVTPAGAVGRRDVVVTPAGGLPPITSSGGFRYVAPTVTAVIPASGLLAGGNTVTVTGTGFGASGTPAVTFGGRAATNVTRTSDTSLTATVPAGAVLGLVAVTVTPALGTGSGSLDAAYTYAPPVRTPLISNVSPDRGPASGGTLVTVTGSNFRGSNNTPATVKLGGTPVSATVAGDGATLTFTTPPLSVGVKNLSITTNEGTANLYFGFSSVGAPSVGGGDPCTAVSPRGFVNYTGSNSVTVNGTGFRQDGDPAPAVAVNGVAATVTASSNTSVTFTIPEVSLGPISIAITPEAADTLTISNCITLRRLLTITATASPSSIDFGDPAAEFSYTVSGLQSGDAIASVALTFNGVSPTTYGPSFDAPSGGGSYRLTPSNASFSAGSASDYDIVYVPITYTINGVPATVTADDKTKVYGNADPTFTSSATGLLNGDVLNEVEYTFSGSGYGPSTTPPTNVGTYTITPSVVSLTPSTSLGNYSFSAVTGTYTITKRPVTVTPDSGQSKVYDGQSVPASSLTYTITTGSLVGGDSLSNVLAVSGTNVGTYAITKSSSADASNPNYDITVVEGSFEITRKPVTVTATADTKTYGDSDPTLTYSTSPTVSLSGSLTRTAGENVGTYAIGQGTVDNDSNPNYDITYNGANLTISKRAITITADDQEITFGDSLPTNSAQVTSGSLVFSDSLSSASYAYSPGSPSDAGEYSITPSAAVIGGGGAGNYDITYEAGTLTISPVTVTVTPDSDQSKTYDDSDPTFTYTYSPSPLPAGVTLSGALGRDSGEDVDTYAFSLGTLAPSSTNVSLELAEGVTFAITPKAVTVTADAQTKSFGDSDPELTYTTSPAGVTLSGSLDRATGEDVGTYAIGEGGVTTANNPNYTITFQSADLTISQATITVTPDSNQSKEYGDDDPTLTYTTSPDVGDALSGSLSRDAGDTVRNYTITQGTITSTSNYIINFTTGVTFGVTKREITITADDQEITFGDSLPTNSSQVTSGSLVTGDSLTGASYAYSPSASPSDAGEYSITPSAAVIGGGGAGNYDITYEAGTLTISPVTVTVTPDSDQSKTYGDSDPTFTYTYDPSPSGVTLSGALGRDSGEDVDTYAFSLGTLAPSNSNAALELAEGVTFAITPLAVTVTADAQSKSFGESDPELTYTTSPDVGDGLSGSLDRATGEDVGTYAIGQGGVTTANNPNYTVTFQTADLTINKATITVTPDSDQSKEYGDDDPTLTYTSDPSGPTLSGALTRDAGETVGDYAITQGTLTSTSNYDIVFTTGVTFGVTKRAITVTADDQEITFGDALPTNGVSLTSGSLLDGDSLDSATYAYTPGSPADAGDYAITPSAAVIGGGGAVNYDITYADGTLTILAKAATVTADDRFIAYGVAPSDPSAVTDGLLDPDAASSVTYTYSGNGYGPSTTPPTAVGAYDVTPSALAVSPGSASNYDVEYVSGVFVIAGTSVGALVPDRGTYLGGTPFTITGTGFGPEGATIEVTFGGQTATGVVRVDNRTITGITPPFTLAEEYTAELVDVTVTVDGTSDTLVEAYTYLPPRRTPVMLTTFPDQGPTVGGTELTVTGTNLGGTDPTATVVLVNGERVTDLEIAEDGSSVTGLTPPGPRGPAREVEIFTNEGAAAFLDAFTYIPPVIDSVSPPLGYTVGGITVVIAGSGFGTAVPTVTIGGVEAEVTANSPTSITIILPAGVAGTEDVVVVPVGDPVGATKADGFTYVPTPIGDVNGALWLDLDKDGVFDEETEPPLPELPVSLTLIEYVLPALSQPAASVPRGLARVQATPTSSTITIPGNTAPVTFTTGPDGRYRFEDLPYGRYRLTLELPGQFDPTLLPVGAAEGLIEIIIDAPEVIADAAGAGRSSIDAIVANEDLVPFPNTLTQLRWWGADQRMATADDVIIRTRTDGQGRVVFTANLPAGQYRAELLDAQGNALTSTTLTLIDRQLLSGDYFIVPGRSTLPKTGAATLPSMVFVAGMLLLIGVGLAGPSPRRRPRRL